MTPGFIVGQSVHMAIFIVVIWTLRPYLFKRKDRP